MGRWSRGFVAVAAVSGIVLAGCGSNGGDDDVADALAAPSGGAGTGATPPTGPVADDAAGTADWCPVTTEQVSSLVHHEMVEGDPCTWSAPELVAEVLEVYVSGTEAGHLAGSAETIDGVGDAAAFDAADALVFEHRGTFWVVQILNMGGASDIVSKDAEVELARLVVAGQD